LRTQLFYFLFSKFCFKNSMFHSPKGFGLIQALLAVALVSGAIFVFATLLSIIQMNKTGSLHTGAYKLAQEQMEILRNLPISDLTTRTNADFVNIIYNNGAAGTVNDISAPSSPETLELSSATSTLNLMLLPNDAISDFTFEASLKASSTPIKTGLMFRTKDINNYYFFYIKSDKIALEKKVGGITSTVYESFRTLSAGTWYKLKITAAGSAISLYLDDTKIQDITDASISSGSLALADVGTPTRFDNISLSYGTTVNYWNFEGLAQGGIPKEWRRFGINNLPDGIGKLTISEPYSSSDIKKIDITVSWVEKGTNKSIILSTLRTQ